MRIAILTFDGFNEIDSFVAFNMINRAKWAGLRAEITCPTELVESGRGLRIQAQQPLEFAREADVVLVGSGSMTPRIVEDASLMSRLQLDPGRQLIGSQCSGALVLARLGVLGTSPACTDHATRPLVEAAGVKVLEQPFLARGNVATSGGCLASHYLATWVIWRLAGRAAAEEVLEYVAPVGQESQYIARAMGTVAPHVETSAGLSAAMSS